jgi:CheY-like chemotaxis protein
MPRILLVEDDADARVVMQHILFDGGYNVDTAPTVDRGCELLAHRDYDVIITDGRLGDGTGMTVADLAREKGIPVLIVTGYAFILDELRAGPAQYDVLLKPIGPSELVDAVARALDSA